MTDDPTTIVFTVKELLQRLDEQLRAVDQKLDIRLAQFEDRITHVERTQAERSHLIDEHRAMRADVEKLKWFRARFLPASLVLVLLAVLGLVTDIYIRIAY